jgi:hypothetical protein
VIDNTKILSGIPIYHAKDKREIAYQGINWSENFSGATIIYTDEFAKKQKVLVSRKFKFSIEQDQNVIELYYFISKTWILTAYIAKPTLVFISNFSKRASRYPSTVRGLQHIRSAISL